MKYRVPFIKPKMPNAQELGEAYKSIVDSNWFTNFGPQEQKLSKELSNYLGDGVSVTTVSNATAGLILAVKALIVPNMTGQKKKVLIPSFTFAAVPESLIWCGLEPVFVDVNKQTWHMDIDQAKQYFETHNEEVAGVLFCNAFGVGSPEIEQWEEFTKVNNLPLIIDSAAGFGSSYSDGKKVGVHGACEVFSFHTTKPFGVGEGGAISSHSAPLIEQLRSLQNFGFGDNREAVTTGLNAKMQEINAVIGLWQLAQLESNLQIRRANLELYKAALTSRGYVFQQNDQQSTVGFVSALAPDATTADKVYDALRDSGIEVNRYYNPPLHKHRAFGQCEKVSELNVTNDLCQRIVSFPAHQDVTQETIQEITKIIDQVSK